MYGTFFVVAGGALLISGAPVGVLAPYFACVGAVVDGPAPYHPPVGAIGPSPHSFCLTVVVAGWLVLRTRLSFLVPVFAGLFLLIG